MNNAVKDYHKPLEIALKKFEIVLATNEKVVKKITACMKKGER